jgi:hypothetical protein
MKKYSSNSNHTPRVIGFETGDDFIILQFEDLSEKKYTNHLTGSHEVILMKFFAQSNEGLEEFLSHNNPLCE